MDRAVQKPAVLASAPEPRTSASLFAPLAVAGFLLAALTFGAGGCAGERQDVLSAHEAHEGEVRVFNVGMDQAWEAARAALRWNHADTIEEHRADGYMLATAGLSAWSWGAAMGVWLEPANAQGTQVRAIVSRKLATNVFAQSEDMLLDDIAKAVALEKQGQPVPDTDPTEALFMVAHDPEPIGVAVLAYTWTLEHGGLVAGSTNSS
jgi:hypothetical protein